MCVCVYFLSLVRLLINKEKSDHGILDSIKKVKYIMMMMIIIL